MLRFPHFLPFKGLWWGNRPLKSVEKSGKSTVLMQWNRLQECTAECSDSTCCAGYGVQNPYCNINIGKKMLGHSSRCSSPEHPYSVRYCTAQDKMLVPLLGNVFHWLIKSCNKQKGYIRQWEENWQVLKSSTSKCALLVAIFIIFLYSNVKIQPS